MRILKVGNVDVKLDDYDWLRFCRYKWRIKKVDKRQSYVVRTMRKKGKHYTIYMHREVMNAPDDMEVHHIKGDTFDNRREELRMVTKIEHGKITRKRPTIDETSD